MAEPEAKTFRGRTLAEVLPQIRAELGPDAIVLRRREGLTGGIGGFFQRSYVEVEAAGPDAAAETARQIEIGHAAEPRNDRATAEGMASPAIQLLLDQASPFADQLQAAQRAGEPHDPAVKRGETPDLLGAGLYGPQPYAPPAPAPKPGLAPEPEAIEPAAPVAEPGAGVAGETWTAPELEPAAVPQPGTWAAAAEAREPAATPEPAAPGGALLAPRSAAARSAERRLVRSGLDSAVAADVVGEALVHGAPFDAAHDLEALVREALVRRIRPLPPRGPRGCSLAFVGSSASGKSTAVANLAAAYAKAGTLPVLVIALRAADQGAALRERLAEHDVPVHAAADGADARRIAAVAQGALTIVDTAAVSVRDAAAIETLAADLRELSLDEVHLAVPATISAASAGELAGALEPLGLTHAALTRMEETEHFGAPVGFCLASGAPLSYVCERGAIAPADPADLAERLL